MAQLKVGALGLSKPVKEKREDALERLLLLACQLLPDDLSLLGENEELAGQVTGEAVFWLDFAPRGAKVYPSVPEKRLGWKDVQERRAAYKLSEDGQSVVPVATPTTPPKPKEK